LSTEIDLFKETEQAKEPSSWRQVSLLAAGTVAAQLINFAVSPLLTRIYSAADFGALAVYTSVIQVMLVCASFRYELAIPIASNEAETSRLVFLSGFLVSSISSAVAVGLLIFKDALVSVFQLERIGPFIWLLPLSIFGGGIYQIFQSYAVRQKRFDAIAQSRIVQAASGAVAQVAGGALGFGSICLFLGQLLNQVGGIVRLGRLFLRNRDSSKLSCKDLLTDAQKYHAFALYSTPSALMNAVSLNVASLVLTYRFNPEIAGFYLLTQRALGVPLGLIGQSFENVFVAHFSEALRTDSGKAQRLIISTVVKTFSITLIPALLGLLFAVPLFQHLFGKQWIASAKIAQILSFYYLIQLCMTPINKSLVLMEKQRWQFIWDLSRLMAVTLVFYFCAAQKIDYLGTLMWFGVVMSVFYLVFIWLAIQAAAKRDI
jgi:O-antigen/teichoic acid export membrane protein